MICCNIVDVCQTPPPKQRIEESYKLRLTTMESYASLHLDPPLPPV